MPSGTLDIAARIARVTHVTRNTGVGFEPPLLPPRYMRRGGDEVNLPRRLVLLLVGALIVITHLRDLSHVQNPHYSQAMSASDAHD